MFLDAIDVLKGIDKVDFIRAAQLLEYEKNNLIYNQAQPSAALYLITDGRVGVWRNDDLGPATLIDIYANGDVFGESAFVHPSHSPEQATALERTKLLSWNAEFIEKFILRQPKLGVILLQVFSQRSREATHRMEGFGWKAGKRLASALLHFAEHLGRRDADGIVRMPPIIHEHLAGYVGTSREIITNEMMQLRRAGVLSYSRRGIAVNSGKLQRWLDAGRPSSESGANARAVAGAPVTWRDVCTSAAVMGAEHAIKTQTSCLGGS